MIKTYLGSLLLLFALTIIPASAQRFSQAGPNSQAGPIGFTSGNVDFVGPTYHQASGASASRHAYIYTDSTLAGLNTANIIRAIEFYAVGANIPTTGCSMKIYVKTTAMRRFPADTLGWDSISASTPLLYNGNPAAIINGTANLATGAFVRFPFSTASALPTVSRPNMLVLVEYSQTTPQPSPLRWLWSSSNPVLFNSGTVSVELARPRQAYMSTVTGSALVSNKLAGYPVGIPPQPAPTYGLRRPTARFVYTVLGSEAEVSFIRPTELVRKPFSQGTMPVVLSYTLGNAGTDTLRNIGFKFEIKNSDSVVVFTSNLPLVVKLAPGASTTFSAPNYLPPLAAKGYTVKYELTLAQSFGSNLPSTFTQRFWMTGSTFARDNGTLMGGYGGGPSVNVQLGVVYEITTAEQLNSVSAFFDVGKLSDSTRLVVYRMGTTASTINTPDATPSAQSPYMRFPALGFQFLTIPLAAPISLAPGRYLFSLEEPPGVENFALQRSRGNIMFNTSFARGYTSAAPSGDWFTMENSTLRDKDVTFIIRPNFTSTARVQFINNSTIDSLATANIFLNRVRFPLVSNLAFRNATAYLANVPAGNHWIGVAPTVPNSSRFIKGVSDGFVNFQEDSTYVVVINGMATNTTVASEAFKIAMISGDRRVSAAGTTNIVMHHGVASPAEEKFRITEYGINTTPLVMANNMDYNSFMRVGSLSTVNGYRLSVQNFFGDTLGKYRADLLALNMGGRGVTILASGTLGTPIGATNSFGLWVALPTGGALVPLPLATTSVSKAASLKVSVYPNPATNMLNIELAQTGIPTDIRLVSLQGSLVHTSKVFGAQSQLDLSGLPSGVYILQLKNAMGQATHRIVKQ